MMVKKVLPIIQVKSAHKYSLPETGIKKGVSVLSGPFWLPSYAAGP